MAAGDEKTGKTIIVLRPPQKFEFFPKPPQRIKNGGHLFISIKKQGKRGDMGGLFLSNKI